MTVTWCAPLGRGVGCAGKPARRQDQLASRAFRLAFYKYCRHRQTVHRTRQTSREIIRGAWPHDLRARERRTSSCLSTWILQPRVSVFSVDFARECAPPPRTKTRAFSVVLIVPPFVPPSASSNPGVRTDYERGEVHAIHKFAWTAPVVCVLAFP